MIAFSKSFRAVWIPAQAALWLIASGPDAAEFYVSPAGKAQNAGTEESPWDIASALNGEQKVGGGDTIFLLEGTYRRRPNAEYDIRLAGTEERPIHIRPAPGARATIDGGLSVRKPTTCVWVWDLEILVSENFSMTREIGEPGSHPKTYNRPWGGLNMHGGTRCKYIHLAIHDCAQGISSWIGAEDVEIYGCLIYDNGWKAPDRGHGHSIYAQNRTGAKTVRHCILSAKYPGSYTMHAYGSSRAFVDNFVVEENIAYGEGPFLIGGGRPSRNIRAFRNVLYKVDMRIGYSAPHNENCEVRDNLIVNGGLSITRYRDAVREGNVVVGKKDKRPGGTRVRWFPSRYDSNRAHLAVFNWTGERILDIDAQPFLAPGDRYRLMGPKDLYGKPVHKGTCSSKSIAVPAERELAVYVAFKERS